VLLLLLSVAAPIIITGPVMAEELRATAISGGKTRPIVDIDNKLVAPERRKPLPEPQAQPQQHSDSAASKVVEDAGKYHLYIDPVYPRHARTANKEAIVELEITFDAEGKMRDALVRSCSAPGWGFEQSALAASLEATLRGHGEREITVRTKIRFRLK
jgi:TonB family protein